ncbi:protein containing Helix-turn-helix type 3 domain protein [gut metagenome]|uniref:Protein containing Helix-turn-helix type 3 domain protein n=1 Tax=gut metagenome TaxID=749906 RepID=J9CGD0_9ZZZZ
MRHLEEESNGFETTFKLTVTQAQATAVRRHLESLLDIINMNKEESERFDFVGYSLPGPKLKRLRLQKNITQKALAEALGTTQVRVSDMEQGIRPITPELAQKCAELFGVSVKNFFN